MFNLCIFLLGAEAQYLLCFDEEANAVVARERLIKQWNTWLNLRKDEQVTVKDDNGRQLDILISTLSSVYLEDVKANMELGIEREIIQRKVNADFLEKRNKDFELTKLFPAQATGTMTGRA